MERAVDRMFMTLLISLDPFLHRRIAENKVGVAHDRKTKLSDFSRMAGGIKGVFPGSSNHESLSRRTSIAADKDPASCGEPLFSGRSWLTQFSS